MATQIKFGTSGWRAVMAEEFTFANVQRAVHGIARYVSSQKSNRAKVIVGRDPRFLGESFCATAADILSSYGITPLVIAEPAPTPTISYAIIQSKADGAINFTASHNPPEYNGIKFSTPDGAPALPEVTQAIEREIAAFDANPQTPGAAKAEAQPQSQTQFIANDRSAPHVSFAAARDRRSRRHQESRHQDCLRSHVGRCPRLFGRVPARGWRNGGHRP